MDTNSASTFGHMGGAARASYEGMLQGHYSRYLETYLILDPEERGLAASYILGRIRHDVGALDGLCEVYALVANMRSDPRCDFAMLVLNMPVARPKMAVRCY